MFIYWSLEFKWSSWKMVTIKSWKRTIYILFNRKKKYKIRKKRKHITQWMATIEKTKREKKQTCIQHCKELLDWIAPSWKVRCFRGINIPACTCDTGNVNNGNYIASENFCLLTKLNSKIENFTWLYLHPL